MEIPKIIVGAKKRPDGTMDYSHAMTMENIAAILKAPKTPVGQGLEEKKESLEVQELKQLILEINRESGKIVWASLEENIWKKIGVLHPGSGQNMAIDGKNPKGFDYNNPGTQKELYQYVSPDKLGAPKPNVFNQGVYEKWVTYKITPLQENVFEKSLVDEEVEVPRIFLGQQIGTRKEKRKVIKDILKGQRPALMADKLENGNRKKAFLLAFKRACKEFSGRDATVDLALILPEELALTTYKFLQKNPKMVDELLERVLPTWITDSSAQIKFERSEHIHGEALK